MGVEPMRIAPADLKPATLTTRSHNRLLILLINAFVLSKYTIYISLYVLNSYHSNFFLFCIFLNFSFNIVTSKLSLAGPSTTVPFISNSDP